ncbi:PREDICTED: uncharacterized protein LOC105144171 [Acromyrmex echinatior]|uniref:uncharacterized protein LOC105144171 n=1 Tax=Acromyrmex echinatior TaxID=103372 RepID=UPI00058102EB|nr:PREDICTED: uncharacterized protein LOC105144171 [Acromyrmex echinatior]
MRKLRSPGQLLSFMKLTVNRRLHLKLQLSHASAIRMMNVRMFGVFTIRENVIMNLCRTEYANMLHENSIHFSLKEHDISNIFFYFRIRQQIKHTNLIYRQIQHIHVKNQMKTNQKIKYYMTPSQIRHIHRNQIKRLRIHRLSRKNPLSIQRNLKTYQKLRHFYAIHLQLNYNHKNLTKCQNRERKHMTHLFTKYVHTNLMKKLGMFGPNRKNMILILRYMSKIYRNLKTNRLVVNLSKKSRYMIFRPNEGNVKINHTKQMRIHRKLKLKDAYRNLTIKLKEIK